MGVNEVYKTISYIAAKNLQDGYISPDDFNVCINSAQRAYASYLLGSFGQYTPGRPVAKVELGQNSVVRQTLAPIIYGYNLNIDVNGYVNYPGDYIQTDAMWSIYGYNRIRFADQHKFASIYNSVIDPIEQNPIYVLRDTGFQFFPSTPYGRNQSFLHYVKNPPEIRWAYTLDPNGLPVYDPVNSLDPVWDSLAMVDIISRALILVGVNLQSGAILQYMDQMKKADQ